jgi:hypothetical protein
MDQTHRTPIESILSDVHLIICDVCTNLRSDLLGQEIENTSTRIRANTSDTISNFW